MKQNTITGILLSAAIAAASCGTVNKNDNSAAAELGKQYFYDYNQVLKAQKNILKEFTWPAKHETDLNDDGVNEEFLAVEGYSRGMDYVLFCKINMRWQNISGEDAVPSGHLGVKKQNTKHDGWHDFVSYQPSGRDGIIESYYTWNKNMYILKKQKEVNY